MEKPWNCHAILYILNLAFLVFSAGDFMVPITLWPFPCSWRICLLIVTTPWSFSYSTWRWIFEGSLFSLWMKAWLGLPKNTFENHPFLYWSLLLMYHVVTINTAYKIPHFPCKQSLGHVYSVLLSVIVLRGP